VIAAITAGGRIDAPFARAVGTTVKALVPIAGVTLLDRAIDAARAAGARRIVVVGGNDVRAACGARVEAVIAESRDGRENVRKALEAGDRSEELVFFASDMPFIAACDVDAFVRRARGADVALPLATANDYAAAYPDAPAHATRIGSECVVNGSVVYFAPGVALRALDVSQRLFDARKSLWRMAALLGPALLVRFALGTLGVADVEIRARSLLALEARAVHDASPGLCFDIDSFEDYRYVTALTRPSSDQLSRNASVQELGDTVRDAPRGVGPAQ